METRTVEQVEGWSTRSFSDGFAGLRELSDGEFSGAVRANGAWLFMLNGRIIGVYEGSLDDFEDADGTAYAAPHPSLPLVFSMQEQGGDTRAKYYTNDTPLTEVDSTLTEGSFTGFVELSENVLSGDYYVAYYGGRSMSVAFVGASDQVVTGDDAFERAADEVGIYEVTDVDIEVTDVPEPEGSDEPDPGTDAPSSAPTGRSSGASSGGSSSEPTGSPSGKSAGRGTPGEAGETGTAGDSSNDHTGRAEQVASQPSTSEPPAGEPPAGQSSTGQPSADQSSVDQSSTDEPTPSRSPPSERADETTAKSAANSTADSGESRSATDAIRQPEAESGTADPEPATEPSAGTTGGSTPAEPDSKPKSSTETTTPEATDAAAARDDAPERTESADAESADGSDDEADAFSEEAEWRETTTIPSLDPDRSEGPDENESPGATSTGSASGTESSGKSTKRAADSGSATKKSSQTSERANAKRQSSGRTASSSGTGSTGASRSAGSGAGRASESGGAGGSAGAGGSERADESAGTGKSGGGDGDAQARVQKLRSQLQQRKQQVQQLKERLSKVESERDEFERERDALRQEVKRLEAKLETAGSGGSSADGRQLSRAQAFDGTNLFVRYQSKGKATLEEAATGEADPEDVNANLRLEHHTQFEADGASVDGRAFEEFLNDSFEYQFVSWIIEDLLYEIRDTGHQSSLQDLYESIPKIDRVDLHGSVSAGGEDEDTRKESFDVIARDRMGNPLLVADLNDSRDPTTGDMMGSLVDAASGVGEAHDELSGAFQVTESFFEPEALETADTATTGGFLSREKRESFVKLSRKRGYHLCLVESRSGGFHLNVPEL